MRRIIAALGLLGSVAFGIGCGTVDCAGLGCTECNRPTEDDLLCTDTGQQEECKVDSDCAKAAIDGPVCAPGNGENCVPLKTGICITKGPTTTLMQTHHPICSSGRCIYQVDSALCTDTACEGCSDVIASCRFSKDAKTYATCCTQINGGTPDCACGVDGACNAKCGGDCNTYSDECAACLQTTMVDGGACVTDSTFEKTCIETDAACRQEAQCLASIPVAAAK